MRNCFALLIALLTFKSTHAALNGTYTINPSAAASASNYLSVVAAVSDLTNGSRPDGGPVNGAGVTGPVNFNISNGTYRGKLNITTIAGTSLTNRITFRSLTSTASNVIIEDSAVTAADNGVIHFKGSKYISFQNVVVRAINQASIGSSGLYAIAIIIEDGGGTNSSNISFYKCRIQSRWFVNVLNNSCVNIKGKQDSISFVRDTLYNAGVGFWMEGNGNVNNYSQKLNIDSCCFMSMPGFSDVFQPFYVKHVRDMSIRYNVVNKNGCCADIMGQIIGVRMPMEFSHNKIYFGNNSAGRGLEFDSLNIVNDANQYASIYNNFIHSNYNSSGSMIRFSRSARVRFVHNNLYSLNSVNTFKMIEINATSATDHVNIEIVNNLFYTNGAPVLNLLGSSAAIAKGNISRLNYNAYYRGGFTGNVLYSILGSNITAASAIPNSIYAGSDSMSMFDVPFSFVANNDLHLVDNPCLWGTNLPAYATDIDGTTRSNPPTIGAHNKMMTGKGNNLAVDAILAPTIAGFVPGLQNIVAMVKNYGTNTVTSYKVGYSVNGGAPKYVAKTGTLAPCDTATVVFTGVNQYNFPAGASFLKVFIDTVNGGLDSVNTNDTLSLTVCSPLAGNYTINPIAPLSSTNFQSFSQLASALNSCGITAAVNVVVSAGTYIENVNFGTIAGNDTTKMITIDGLNPALVILKRKVYNAGINYVVRFDNTNAITFKNIYMQSDSANMGSLVQAIGGVRLIVKRCILEYTGAAATSTNFALKAFHISSSYSNTTTANASYTDVTIDSCVINNGYSGVEASFTSNSAICFIRNTIINNAYGYGIYGNSGAYRIFNNYISMRNNAANSNIQLFNANPNAVSLYNQISNNILPRCGTYGIYLSTARGGNTIAKKGEMYNNMIGGAFMSSGSNYGISLNYSDLWNIFNNSISMDSARASGGGVCRGIFIPGFAYYNNLVKNNSISITDVAVANPYCIEIQNKIYVDTFGGLDHNNYFNAKNKNILLLGAVTYDSTNFKIAYPNGAGANSRYGNPNYISRYNLHTTNVQLNDWANATLGVTTDIDGDLRKPTPDVGADEFDPTVMKDLKAWNLLQPVTTACFGGSTYPIQGEFKNVGTDSILLTTDTIYTYAKVTDPNNVNTLLGPIKFFSQIIKKDSLIRPVFSAGFPMSVYGVWKVQIFSSWVNDNFFTNDSATFNINVTNPVPGFIQPATTSVCSNDSLKLTASPTKYANGYQWYLNGAPIAGATDSNYFAKAAGKYYCVVTSPAGCSKITDSVTLTVNPAPTPSFTKDKNGYCPGDSVKLSASTAANMSYQWFLNGGPLVGATDTIYYAKNSGNYSVKMTNLTTNCTATTPNQFVASYTNPTATIAPTSGNICTGDSMKITANQNVNFTYQWLFNSGNITGATDSFYFAKNTGTYNVKITDTSTGCSAVSNNSTLSVQTAVSANISSVSKTSFCVGDSSILKCTFIANSTFQWLKNNVPIPGANDTIYVAKTSGNYAIKLTNTIAGCTVVSTPVTITANAYPVAFINYTGPNVLCFGASLELKADTTNGTGNTYQWMNNNVDISGETNFNYTLGANGSYSVRISRNGCVSTSAAKNITIEPKIDTSMIISGNTVGCFGNSVTFTLPTGPNLNFEWYKNALITGATGNSYTAKTSGVYQAKIKSALSGCFEFSRLVTIDFAVVKIPTIKPVVTSKCAGDSIKLEMTNIDTSVVSFKWIYNGNTMNNKIDSFVFVKNTGTYVGQITNTRGCSLFTDNNKDLTFFDALQPKINSTNLKACEGDSIALSLSTIIPATTIKWFENSNQLTGVNGTSYTTKKTGTYNVFVSAGVCESNSASVTVTINPNPAPVITKDTVTGELTSSIFSGNQWYKDSVVIFNAKKNVYLPTASGSYYTVVKDAVTGCSGTSNKISVVIVGSAINAIQASKIKIYPNPSVDYVEVSFEKVESHVINVYSMDHKLVLTQAVNAGDQQTRLNLTELAAGTYLMKIKEGNDEFTYKVIKQ